MASLISCIKLLNPPFSSRFRNNSGTHFFFLFPFFVFFIKNKTTSCKNKMFSSSESDVISKELQHLSLIYYNANLMTDVFKVIVKYRRKIIARYRQILSFVAQWVKVFSNVKKKSNSRFAIKVTKRSNHSFLLYT